MSRRLGPLVVAGVFVALAAWTWGKWLDPIIDFGRELYVPWQLTEGRVLYRDLAWFNGPLSPYFNAALFAVFGVGLSTLVWANLVILAGVTALLFRQVAAIGDRRTATAGAVVFLTHSAFGQKIWVGNFNWVCPYSHEMTHGLALTLLALAAAQRWVRNRAGGALVAAGVCAGACALTKPELLVGCGLALAVAFGSAPRRAAGRPWRAALVFGLSAALPVSVAWLLLATALPVGEALRGTLGGWLHVFNDQLRALPYYRAGIGTDDTARSLQLIGAWALAYAVLFGLPALLLRRRRSWPTIVPSVVVLAWAGWCIFATEPLEYGDTSAGYQNAYRPLLLVALGAAAVAARRVVGDRGDERARATLVFAVLALGLLAKMFLHVRSHHYGFVLAVPALMLAVVGLVDWLPAVVARRGGAARPQRVLGVLALVLAVLFQLRTDAYWYHDRDVRVGEGRDAFYGARGGRGEGVQRFLAELDEHLPPGAPMLVMPEGVTLNYLSRRPGVGKYFNFMPPEIAMFGEAAIVEELERRSPRYVLVVDRRTTEYGVDQFGLDYGQAIRAWVGRHLRPIWKFGAEPLTRQRLRDRLFGIWVLERR